MNRIKSKFQVLFLDIKRFFNQRHLLRNIIIVGIICILVPILLFIYNFKGQQLSANISDWGVFGDFMGGILNPILSLLSLALLTYITILLGRKSNEEAKKLFILQRKIEAFDKLNSYQSFFTQFEIVLAHSTHDITNFYTMYGTIDAYEYIEEWVKKDKEGIFKLFKIFDEFYPLLLGFQISYSHYFTYFDYKIRRYNALLDEARILSLYLKDLKEKLYKCKPIEGDYLKVYKNFMAHYTPFLMNLKQELKNGIGY